MARDGRSSVLSYRRAPTRRLRDLRGLPPLTKRSGTRCYDARDLRTARTLGAAPAGSTPRTARTPGRTAGPLRIKLTYAMEMSALDAAYVYRSGMRSRGRAEA